MKNQMILDFSKATAMEIQEHSRCVMRAVMPENIFHFQEGILGFESVKDYIIVLNDNLKPFMMMKSISSALTFVCVESFTICPDYHLSIPQSCVDALNLKDSKDALILSLVTVRSKMEDTTANLMSPVILNMKNKTGRQIIVENSEFPVQYRILDAIAKRDTNQKLA